MGFVDRHILGRAIHLAGGGVHDTPDPQIGGGLHHVQSAGHVGIDVAFRGQIGIGDADQGGEMQYGLAARHGLTHGVGIADVSGDDFDTVEYLGRRIVEPAPGAPGIVFHKGTDLCPVCGKPLDQMGADEPARARHKNLRHSASHARLAAGRPDAGMLGEYG